jgi:hypothetical protein
MNPSAICVRCQTTSLKHQTSIALEIAKDSHCDIRFLGDRIAAELPELRFGEDRPTSQESASVRAEIDQDW